MLEKTEKTGVNVNPEGARQAILQAALKTFLEHGFGATSMEKIAQAANVSRRTVFNQFASKEALFNASVEQVWTGMPVLEISTDQRSFADPQAGLRELGLAISDFWARPESVALVRLIISEARTFPGLAQNYLERGKVPALRSLISYLENLKERGQLRLSDPDLAARQFVGLINEPLLWFRVLGLTDEPDSDRRSYVVSEAVAMFLSRYPMLPTHESANRHR